MEEQKEGEKRIPKGLKIAAIIASVIIIFLIAAFYGLSWYGEWNLQKDIMQIIKQQNLPFLEDTYGGKTPKETLELFIAAVEKEDFALASKYFVLGKQKEWEKELSDINKINKTEEFLFPIRTEIQKLSIEKPLWDERDTYVSGDSILFVFAKYPSGIWKIQEL